MQVLIIDPDRKRRRHIKKELSSSVDEITCYESASASEAYLLIPELEPDLLILHRYLADQDGISFIANMDNPPAFIFLTDQPEFAQQAMDNHALDCLTYPVYRIQLGQAITKAKVLINYKISSVLKEHDHVLIKDGQQCWYPKIQQIRLLETYGNYTRLYFDDQQALAHRSLQQLENRLPDSFFRINRQRMINLNHIKKIEPAAGETFEAELTCGLRVHISRRRSKVFREMKEL